jgi:hypothetical protein
MKLEEILQTVLFEELNIQTISLALRSAVLHNNNLDASVLAKEVIAKQAGKDNFIEEILKPTRLTNNELARKIAIAIRDEIFGLNATKKFGQEKL